ncbi:MAG TPA: alpha/beta fold hydrolase [Candidatus Thermoplasmatota archaeon]|nr:alpha/beta fold hydrolase [Candidatus Thermoplasmatota archaeon]
MTPTLHHIVRPARPGPGKPPVLILLHGVGSNERDMASLAPAMDPRFLVVSVRSPIELGPDAFAWFHVTFNARGPAIDAKEAAAGWKALNQFIREVVAKYAGDATRVYVAGFSQGGIMSLAALLTAPELVAGAVCMSGRLLPELLPNAASRDLLARKAVLVVHGTADTRLGIDYARNARATLQELAIDLTYHELPMGHEITPDSLAITAKWLSSRLDEPQRNS